MSSPPINSHFTGFPLVTVVERLYFTSFHFGFEGGKWNRIVVILDQCPCFYFTNNVAVTQRETLAFVLVK